MIALLKIAVVTPDGIEAFAQCQIDSETIDMILAGEKQIYPSLVNSLVRTREATATT